MHAQIHRAVGRITGEAGRPVVAKVIELPASLHDPSAQVLPAAMPNAELTSGCGAASACLPLRELASTAMLNHGSLLVLCAG